MISARWIVRRRSGNCAGWPVRPTAIICTIFRRSSVASERDNLFEQMKNLNHRLDRTNDERERQELWRRIQIINARLKELGK